MITTLPYKRRNKLHAHSIDHEAFWAPYRQLQDPVAPIKGEYSMDDLSQAFVELMDGRLQYNSSDRKIWFDDHPLQPGDVTRIRERLENRGLKLRHDKVEELVNIAANENTFDSTVETLEDGSWDGVERLDNMAERYFGRTDESVNDVLSQLITNTIRRQHTPGASVNVMPLFTQESFLKALMGDQMGVLYESRPTTGGVLKASRGKMVVNFDDLSKVNRRAWDVLQSLVLTNVDHGVSTDGHRETVSRRFVFTGTLRKGNVPKHLKDLFPVIDVPANWNKDLLAEESEQLFFEAQERIYPE